MGTLALSKVAERMPSVFDDFFKPWNDIFDVGLTGRIMNVPAVNITEQKDDYMVSLAAPGLKKEDFKIDLKNDYLTVSSEKRDKKEETEKGKVVRSEFRYTSFQRSFAMPKEIDISAIKAAHKNGVLTIELPKKVEFKENLSRQIEIQ